MNRLPDLLGTLPRQVECTPYELVFVCTGNICRSPMAEVATKILAEATVLPDGTTLGERLIITSAGTGPWHEGEPMDPRANAALLRAGYPEYPHVAHQISVHRLKQTNLILALDGRHQQTLRSLGVEASRLFLLRSFDPSAGAASDVPDPYYGDEAGFDTCLEMIDKGCKGLVAALALLWEELPPFGLTRPRG
jgi:protein-tyrosine phosphatase